MNSEFNRKTIKKILANKKKIEKKLSVKIEIKGNKVEISGNELDIYAAEKVFEALERNFPTETALLLTEEDYMLENLLIKSITKKKNLSTIRARIIGTKGKTLKLISELSDCYLTLNENTVSIIGQAEKIKECINAVKSLILGSKQANVYSYLERARTRKGPGNLGLR